MALWPGLDRGLINLLYDQRRLADIGNSTARMITIGVPIE
jgi:hypothetical protein